MVVMSQSHLAVRRESCKIIIAHYPEYHRCMRLFLHVEFVILGKLFECAEIIKAKNTTNSTNDKGASCQLG